MGQMGGEWQELEGSRVTWGSDCSPGADENRREKLLQRHGGQFEATVGEPDGAGFETLPLGASGKDSGVSTAQRNQCPAGRN